MNENISGLDLSLDAIIGDQIRGENRWLKPDHFHLGGNDVDALMGWDEANNGAYQPLLPEHQLIVQSRGMFEINSSGISDPTDIYWAYPRIVGATDDANVWFIEVSGTPSSEPICYATYWPSDDDPWTPGIPAPERRSVGDDQVISDTYIPYRGDGWLWDAQFRLFGKLKNFPDLRPDSSDAATWYTTQQSLNLGSLRDIYDGTRNLLSLDSTQKQAQKSAYAELVHLVYQSDSLITSLQGTLTTTQKDSLYLQQDSNATQIADKADDYRTLLNSYKSGALVQASDLLETLNALTVTSDCEVNMRDVLRIQLECIVNDTVPNSSQHTTLESIADQCIYTGGWAVTMARLMLPENSYTEEDGCSSGRQAASQRPALLSTNGIKVFPNPVYDVLNIQVNQSFEKATGRIYDAQGNLIKSWTFTQNIQELNDLQLNSGVYCLILTTDGKMLPARSFTVIR